MSATNTFECQILQHIFTNSSISNIGDASGFLPSAAAGNLYIGLLTAASDLEAGSVTEANYGGYNRVAMCRNTGNWTVSNNTVTNASAVSFPTASSGTNCACYFGIYTASTDGTLLINGTISTPIEIKTGIKPEFGVSSLSVSLD